VGKKRSLDSSLKVLRVNGNRGHILDRECSTNPDRERTLIRSLCKDHCPVANQARKFEQCLAIGTRPHYDRIRVFRRSPRDARHQPNRNLIWVVIVNDGKAQHAFSILGSRRAEATGRDHASRIPSWTISFGQLAKANMNCGATRRHHLKTPINLANS
jgi:hypothetical protein